MFGLSPESIASGGLILIGLIVFAESGLLIGFFLPGDTLLISAGIIASQGDLPLTLTIITIAVAAMVGDNVGYTIGKYSGKRLLHKKDGILYKREYIERAEVFYEKHGIKTVLFARFVAIIRTFSPLVAGITHMNRAKFVFYDMIGAITWATSITLLGYWVGQKVPKLGDYLELTLIAVVLISVIPTLWHIFGNPKSRHLLKERLNDVLSRRRSPNKE
jgi:membrane-associated protein